ncbi:MAG TPA: aspartate-semialdehyde dehydrogenase [Candidatus Xenobia bacterium]|jgi:aspartate-semialdehyde dehydrogenase
MREYSVAVVGASGAVGQEMLRVLQQRQFPVKSLRAFATRKSAGQKIEFKGQSITVEDVEGASFRGIEVALFAGGEVASSVYAPKAVAEGALVIDNSSHFRMDPKVPLVVPEVNPDALKQHSGLIANPNCSTIQMVVVLKPIHDAARIKRVVMSSYQAVSGTGKAAMDELQAQMQALVAGQPVPVQVYPHQIALNVLPQIGGFGPDGYSEEETKVMNETRKIMGDDRIAVTATTVRVPVLIGHSEAINVETERPLTAAEVRDLMAKAPGIKVVDDPAKSVYPLPILAAGQDDVLVGRIRKDLSHPNGIELWIAADNLRKGAATNAIQIAETMLNLALV